jgi:diadenosine tetraphosphate (Ap4A) HIT family hydrolase
MPTKTLDFMGGVSFTVKKDTCRGCFMNDHEHLLPATLAPILDDGCFTVRQDAEWPVPGFLVVALREHIGTIADLDLNAVRRLGILLRFIRLGMREVLDLRSVQMYQEDKLVNAHLHFWLLPLWTEVMARHTINPRIYESNLRRYLELFIYEAERERIEVCNNAMARFLESIEELRTEGFFPDQKRTEPVR